MSQAALSRIEQTLARLGQRQDEILERITRLETRTAPGGPPTRQEVIAFLDGFRAFEALGETSVGAWIARCTTDCLKGGLRSIQMREGAHAHLLEQRLKELGGTPSFEVPEAEQREKLGCLGSEKLSDLEKLQEVVAMYPSVDAVVAPIEAFAARLGDDLETRSLLQTIAQDERSSTSFLIDACTQLSGRA
jgi:hypothetical protein